MPCNSPPTTGGLCIGLEMAQEVSRQRQNLLKREKKKNVPDVLSKTSLSIIITVIILFFLILVLNSFKPKKKNLLPPFLPSPTCVVIIPDLKKDNYKETHVVIVVVVVVNKEENRPSLYIFQKKTKGRFSHWVVSVSR